MPNIKNIYTGWANFMKADEGSTALAKKRAVHCAACPHAKKGLLTAFIKDELKEVQGYYCELCTCPLSAKLRTPDHGCPINKWKPETATNY